ncbi:MAG: 30S ribosomal protein S6--L-glutamate ligase, partial [Saprospiraceae bacterium]|nr:30S ribosomal protein S6--L-glutamate ligase [Saprospiraceae bacterium]
MNLLILSRNPALYSTHSILVAARRRGHFVRIVDHLYCDLIIEQDHPEVYYNNAPLRNFDAIIPRIGSTATDYGAAVIRQFEARGVYTTVGADALVKARDKLICLQLLAGAGIPVPKTLLTNNMVMLPFLLDHLGGHPLIVKMQNSTQGIGVIRTENRINTETTVEAFNKLREKIIIQEFIKEANGEDIRVFIIDGEIVAT